MWGRANSSNRPSPGPPDATCFYNEYMTVWGYTCMTVCRTYCNVNNRKQDTLQSEHPSFKTFTPNCCFQIYAFKCRSFSEYLCLYQQFKLFQSIRYHIFFINLNWDDLLKTPVMLSRNLHCVSSFFQMKNENDKFYLWKHER